MNTRITKKEVSESHIGIQSSPLTKEMLELVQLEEIAFYIAEEMYKAQYKGVKFGQRPKREQWATWRQDKL